MDAYTVANSDLREHIEARENNYLEVKKNLEKEGYQVERAYFGSEDGEAILFRKRFRRLALLNPYGSRIHRRI